MSGTVYLDIPKEKAASVISDRTNASSEFDDSRECITIKTGRGGHIAARLFDYEFPDETRGTKMDHGSVGPLPEGKGGRKARNAVSEFIVEE